VTDAIPDREAIVVFVLLLVECIVIAVDGSLHCICCSICSTWYYIQVTPHSVEIADAYYY